MLPVVTQRLNQREQQRGSKLARRGNHERQQGCLRGMSETATVRHISGRGVAAMCGPAARRPTWLPGNCPAARPSATRLCVCVSTCAMHVRTAVWYFGSMLRTGHAFYSRGNVWFCCSMYLSRAALRESGLWKKDSIFISRQTRLRRSCTPVARANDISVFSQYDPTGSVADGLIQTHARGPFLFMQRVSRLCAPSSARSSAERRNSFSSSQAQDINLIL